MYHMQQTMLDNAESSEYTPRHFSGRRCPHAGLFHFPGEIHNNVFFPHAAAQSGSFQRTFSESSENNYSPKPIEANQWSQAPRFFNLTVQPDEPDSGRAIGIQAPFLSDGQQPLNHAFDEAYVASIGNPTDQPAPLNSPITHDLYPDPNSPPFLPHGIQYSGMKSCTPRETQSPRMQLSSPRSARLDSAVSPDNPLINKDQFLCKMPASQMMERERHFVQHQLHPGNFGDGPYYTTKGSLRHGGPHFKDMDLGYLGYTTFDSGESKIFGSSQAFLRPVDCM